MRLLFDENLSQLALLLDDLFPHSIHVREVSLKAADDPLVWEYARDNDLTLVSKDSDMHQRSFVFGPPPKVIWVRLGNCSTLQVEQLLRLHSNAIEAFHEDAYASFLSLS